MRNLKTTLSKLTLGITTAITIDSYRRLLNSEYVDKETNQLLQETIRKSQEIIKKLEEQSSKLDTEVETRLNEVRQSLEIIEAKTHNLSQIGTDEFESNKEFIIENAKELNGEANFANDVMEQVMRILGGNDNNPFFSDHLSDVFNQFNQFIHSLNSIQLGALSHILTYLCIIFLVWNILLVFYSDWLIQYYKLEEKYPKWSRFIQWRKKFQHYYILIYSLFTFFILIYMMYVDALLLVYTLK